MLRRLWWKQIDWLYYSYGRKLFFCVKNHDPSAHRPYSLRIIDQRRVISSRNCTTVSEKSEPTEPAKKYPRQVQSLWSKNSTTHTRKKRKENLTVSPKASIKWEPSATEKTASWSAGFLQGHSWRGCKDGCTLCFQTRTRELPRVLT